MRDANLTPTGRELVEPAATLIECIDPEGLKHTVIAYDEAFVGHPALTTGVELIQSFMAYPMVTGLVECSAADVRRGRFAYPTGAIWTLKEVMRSFEQLGQAAGARAALEVCYLAGMILHEAGETGPLQGCFSHGNLTPWRIALRADGQLQVFGYGLPQVEMDRFLRGELAGLQLDSIRYAPPERVEGQPEQPSSDIYSLTTIAFEMIVGKPLYDHADGDAMLQAVRLAEGLQRIAKAGEVPPKVQQVLGAALLYDPDRRLQGTDFVEAIGSLLDDPSIPGRTLIEIMDRMGNRAGQGKRKLVKAEGTAAFTPEQLRAMAEDDGDVEADDATEEAPPTERPRWSSLKGGSTTGRSRLAARRRRTPEAAAPRAEPAPRQLRRGPDPEPPPSEEPEAPRRLRRAPPPPDPSTLAGLGMSVTPREAPAPATPPSAATEPEEAEEENDLVPRRRRRRRLGADDDTGEESPPAPTLPTTEASAVSEASDRPVPTEDDASTDDDGVTQRRRRRRRLPADLSTDPPEPPESQDPGNPIAEDAAPDSDEPAPPRRRRRRRKPDS